MKEIKIESSRFEKEGTVTFALPKTRSKRLRPAVLLFFLAPLFGEYLLGNLKISEIVYLPFIAPLYGAGALLIRETARRTGRGSATMLILGVAYGLFEEGLVDQMLFNQFYFVGQDQMSDTYISALGIDAWLTLIVLAMHAIWSIYIPIALVEALFPEWGSELWLGRNGMIITAMLFILGSVYLGYTISVEENFLAAPAQLGGTLAVIALLVTLAFVIRHPGTADLNFLPYPWLAGVFALVVSSLFMLTEALPGWTKVIACLFLSAVFFTVTALWSHHSSWSPLHRLAAAGGGILTYAWLGVFMEPESGPKSVFDYAGSIVLAVGTILLLVIAIGKLRKFQQVISEKEIR
jgi:hypothetical protein